MDLFLEKRVIKGTFHEVSRHCLSSPFSLKLSFPLEVSVDVAAKQALCLFLRAGFGGRCNHVVFEVVDGVVWMHGTDDDESWSFDVSAAIEIGRDSSPSALHYHLLSLMSLCFMR